MQILRVTVGPVVFSGLTGDGFLVTPDGFVGFDDSSPVRSSNVARATSHGSFVTPRYKDSRTVTVSGYCIAASAGKLASYRDRLMGLLSDGSVGQIVVLHGGKSLSLYGEVDGTPAFDVVAPDGVATFSISFWCADPRKYGDYNTVGPAASTVTAVHYGNFAAAPVITVAGAMPTGYSIFGPAGKVYTVTAAVTAGVPHTIDMATGYLSIGGVIQTGVVTVANTWTVPSGGSAAMFLVPVTGSGTITAATRDTYT